MSAPFRTQLVQARAAGDVPRQVVGAETTGASRVTPSNQRFDWTVWVRPALAILLILLALLNPWSAIPSWLGGAVSPLHSILVMLALLLAIPAALLPRLQRLGVVPLEVGQASLARSLLLAPLGLAVLVAIVQHVRGAYPLGAAVLLATCACVLIAGMQAPSSSIPSWRSATLVTLGLAALVSLFQLRDLFDTFGGLRGGIQIVLAVVWTCGLATWYGAILIRRERSDWQAMSGLVVVLLLGIGLVPSIGYSQATLAGLLLMAGLVMGSTEGMEAEFEGQGEVAGAGPALSRSIGTIWLASGAYLALLGLGGLVAPRGSFFSLWLLALGVGQAAAAAHARRRLGYASSADRTTVLAIAGVSTFLTLVTVLVPGHAVGVVSVPALLAPLALTAVLLLRPTPTSPDATENDPVARTPLGGSHPRRPEPAVAAVGLGSTGQAAEPLQRFLARLIDDTLLVVVVTLAQVVVGFFGTMLLVGGLTTGLETGTVTEAQFGAWGAGYMLMLLTLMLLAVLVFPLYNIAMVARSGATLGKRAMKLAVVSEDGSTPPSWGAATKRYLLLMVPLVPWSILFDDSGAYRGWHDKVAGTRVISRR